MIRCCQARSSPCDCQTRSMEHLPCATRPPTDTQARALHRNSQQHLPPPHSVELAKGLVISHYHQFKRDHAQNVSSLLTAMTIYKSPLGKKQPIYPLYIGRTEFLPVMGTPKVAEESPGFFSASLLASTPRPKLSSLRTKGPRLLGNHAPDVRDGRGTLWDRSHACWCGLSAPGAL